MASPQRTAAVPLGKTRQVHQRPGHRVGRRQQLGTAAPAGAQLLVHVEVEQAAGAVGDLGGGVGEHTQHLGQHVGRQPAVQRGLHQTDRCHVVGIGQTLLPHSGRRRQLLEHRRRDPGPARRLGRAARRLTPDGDEQPDQRADHVPVRPVQLGQPLRGVAAVQREPDQPGPFGAVGRNPRVRLALQQAQPGPAAQLRRALPGPLGQPVQGHQNLRHRCLPKE
jgi:hypothetical protein